jgi:hypothetical protein
MVWPMTVPPVYASPAWLTIVSSVPFCLNVYGLYQFGASIQLPDKSPVPAPISVTDPAGHTAHATVDTLLY